MEGEGKRDKDQPLSNKLKDPTELESSLVLGTSIPCKNPQGGFSINSYWMLLVPQVPEMLQCLLVAYSAVIFWGTAPKVRLNQIKSI